MISINIHNIVSIKPGLIRSLTMDNGDTFYSRHVTITARLSSGEMITHDIVTYSDDGHDLLIADPEVESITCSEVERRKLPRLAA
jgi:hypothetical protein